MLKGHCLFSTNFTGSLSEKIILRLELKLLKLYIGVANRETHFFDDIGTAHILHVNLYAKLWAAPRAYSSDQSQIRPTTISRLMPRPEAVQKHLPPQSILYFPNFYILFRITNVWMILYLIKKKNPRHLHAFISMSSLVNVYNHSSQACLVM